LTAAVLFGLSAPLVKLLLPATGPLCLAALLYLGAGLGLTAVTLVAGRGAAPREARLRGSDHLLLLAVITAGGVVAPVCLLVGLARVSAVVASLLLNLETPLTILLAVILFGEHLGRRAAGGAILIVVGAGVLTYTPGYAHGEWRGVVAIVLACLGWAIDNNFTQRLSVRDPVAIARAKGLVAGAFTLALALASGASLPALRVGFAAPGVGFVSYGLSVVLAVRAMRILGAARQAAFFSTAPFVGAIAAVPLLGEHLRGPQAGAAGLMVIGVLILLTEAHGHHHAHEPLEHDHMHVHDEHHEHEHDESVLEPHAHVHRHAAVEHAHPHVSDVHHRHRH